MFKLADVQNRYCSALLDNKHLMAELKDADVIIGDSVYPCASMIAAKYSIPHVAILMSVLATPMFHAYGIHNPPAYAVQVLPGIPGRLNFLQRVQNVFGWMATYLVFHLFFCTPYEGIKVKYNIVPHQSVQETIGTVDLIIAQVEFPLETPRPLLPSEYSGTAWSAARLAVLTHKWQTPIYFLYRDVPPVRVSFSGSSGLNRVYSFTFLCLQKGRPVNLPLFFPFDHIIFAYSLRLCWNEKWKCKLMYCF